VYIAQERKKRENGRGKTVNSDRWFDIGKGESEEETKKQGIENKWKRVVVRCRTTDRRKGEEPEEKISGIDRAWKRYFFYFFSQSEAEGDRKYTSVRLKKEGKKSGKEKAEKEEREKISLVGEADSMFPLF
jgi:hypothetical protein